MLPANGWVSGDLEQAGWVDDWRAWLGNEDRDAVDELRKRTRTGRPCGGREFIRRLEAALGRILTPRRPGPKPKGTGNHAGKKSKPN